MIASLDHLVLTTRDLDECIHFYRDILGAELIRFNNDRYAFKFGTQKINVHVYGHEIEPKAHLPVPGALDLCFTISCTIDAAQQKLQQHDVEILEGPVKRTGAMGSLTSLYVRDPDLNLVELSTYN